MTMSDAELLRKLDNLLDLVDRDNYACSDDLAEELQDELEHDVVDSQHYMIAEEVEAWWARQD